MHDVSPKRPAPDEAIRGRPELDECAKVHSLLSGGRLAGLELRPATVAKGPPVVDDSPAICSMLAAAFSAAGWLVQACPDAPTVRAIHCASNSDIILAALQMPGESGCELDRQIAERFPATRTESVSSIGSECDPCPLKPQCPFIQIA